MLRVGCMTADYLEQLPVRAEEDILLFMKSCGFMPRGEIRYLRVESMSAEYLVHILTLLQSADSLDILRSANMEMRRSLLPGVCSPVPTLFPPALSCGRRIIRFDLQAWGTEDQSLYTGKSVY